MSPRFIRTLIAIVVAMTAAALLAADDTPSATLFPARSDSRLWLAGQANVITQEHGTFDAPYSGPNSLLDRPERATSRVFTLYSTYRTSRSTELLLDVESAGGRGISDALGLAGFTNLDVVRNPALGAKPYIARAQFHAVLPFSSESERAERTPLSGFAELPIRRVELRAGKLSTADLFDVNGVGSDSHLQFLNWTIDNNGAYDYAADTRGYTWGIYGELHVPRWSLRGGVMLMPSVANGIHYDHDVRHARGENLEVELRPAIRSGRAAIVRVLVYRNLARMGSYREALAGPGGELPDITLSRRAGRTKYGIGINAEEELLTERTRAFGRLGWSDGRNESFAYTEVDRTAEIGLDARPLRSRPLDKVGIAAVTNALSDWHRRYLAAGGVGFLLGDGALHYGRERIVEGYYTAFLKRGVYLSLDLQAIDNPGDNRDRGPVLVRGVRLHVDF